jgi:hypothetical protein
METTFYISLNLLTPDGLESFGKFYLGNDKKEAADIFKLLKGDDSVSEKTILNMDLTEDYDGIPITLEMIHCSLEELACNTKIVSREIFKKTHLKS